MITWFTPSYVRVWSYDDSDYGIIYYHLSATIAIDLSMIFLHEAGSLKPEV